MQRTFVIATPQATPELRRTVATYNSTTTSDFLVPSLISVASIVSGFAALKAADSAAWLGVIAVAGLAMGFGFLAVALHHMFDNYRVRRAIQNKVAVELPLALLHYLRFLLGTWYPKVNERELLIWVSSHAFSQLELTTARWDDYFEYDPERATHRLHDRLLFMVNTYVQQLPKNKDADAS